MILQALNELHDRLKDDDRYGIAPPGYSWQGIGFKIVLSPTGELLGVEDMRSTDSPPRPRHVRVPGGDKPSGQATEKSVHDRVRLLRIDLGFLLSLKNKKGTNGKSLDELESAPFMFEAYRDFHESIEEDVDDEHFSSVCKFLRSWNPKREHERSRDSAWIKFALKNRGIFQIVGEAEFVHQRPAVDAWWNAHWTESLQSEEAVEGQCLVMGGILPLAPLHEPMVKGFGQQSATLVSFNEGAYESYGKKQSYNAPTSKAVVVCYTKALNALTSGPMCRKHKITLGDTTLLFWTDRPTKTEDVFAQFAASASSVGPEYSQDEGLLQKLEAFLTALRRGREAYAELEDDPENTVFYLLGLAPNKARLSVRFFQRASLAELLDKLRLHLKHIEVKGQPAHGKRKADPEFPSLHELLDQTCPLKKGKPDREKIPPILSGPFLRAVIGGVRYPNALYTAVLRRIRAGDPINYLRACLISGHLRRNLNLEIPVSLDITRSDVSYRLGRLFATLEKTQKDALEGINATIRDRFYSSASATPLSVFPRLLRTYQHHLAKLEGGHKVNRETLLQEILGEVANIPPHLDMAAQGLFALGYYHQTQAFYTKKES